MGLLPMTRHKVLPSWLQALAERVLVHVPPSMETSERLEHPWNKTLSFRGVFQCLPEVKAIESLALLHRAMGIEPTSESQTQ
jgi:hypothetical protein